MVKQNNSLVIDSDTVNISTTNTTLNNQMDVDNIATRMKSNKRRRNKPHNSKDGKFTLDVGLVDENFTFIRSTSNSIGLFITAGINFYLN